MSAALWQSSNPNTIKYKATCSKRWLTVDLCPAGHNTLHHQTFNQKVWVGLTETKVEHGAVYMKVLAEKRGPLIHSSLTYGHVRSRPTALTSST